MSSLELSAILLPALFAGLVAILATVVIERGGGALGGQLQPMGLAFGTGSIFPFLLAKW